jgi:hypothetical protein
MKSFYKLFICFCFYGFILGQVAPFVTSPSFNKKESTIINARPQRIGNQSIIQNDNRDQFIFRIKSDTPHTKARVYIIDENNAYSGPYYFKTQEIVTNPFTCMECTILIEQRNQSNSLEFELLEITKPVKIHDAVIIPQKKSQQRENPVILVTGFWPPTNEMIRHFSTSDMLNPEGWQGNDWEGRGYDVVSYFPEFENPDCDNCGMGYGNFEVDYQDTSNDFWPIVNALNPIAIITFSRGYIDLSWEMEFNYYNRLNWIGDYQTPVLPTPNPPDDSVSNYFVRNSTLPVENLVDAIASANLGLDPYVDWNGHPGQFVSEFMGYHGVWYQDTHSFGDNVCVIAGHIHVGGLIDWDTARLASEVSIREVINFVDQFTYTSGDINDDDVIDILDIVILVNAIMGTTELTMVQSYAADLNGDGNINIQDIILTINIILS